MRGKIKEHLFIKEIYGDGMNLFRNESHSRKMKTIPKVESQAAQTLYRSSLKLELHQRIYENKQTTIKITICNKNDSTSVFAVRFTVCSLLESFGSRFV